MKYLFTLAFSILAFSSFSQINIQAGGTSGGMLGFNRVPNYLTSGFYAGVGYELGDVNYQIIYSLFFTGSDSFEEQVFATSNTVNPSLLDASFLLSTVIDDFSVQAELLAHEVDDFKIYTGTGLGYFTTTQKIQPQFNEANYFNPYQLVNLQSNSRVYTQAGIKIRWLNEPVNIDLKGEIYFMDTILGVVYLNYQNHYFFKASVGLSKTF